AWQSAYGLDSPSLLPPKAISLARNLPPPAHLEDCTARTSARQGAERAGAAWAVPGGNGSSCCGCSPQPPWVFGPDDNNLALTRTVQRDIWLSQFPPGSCDGKRLLIVPWVLESGSEGLGGVEGLALQVHVMGALLGLAVETGRVLVPLSGSFSYANNSACKAMGQHGQWGCYFSPIASSDCAKRAQKEMQSGSLRSRCSGRHIRNVALSAEPIVCLHPDFDHNELKLHAAVVTKWGAPHLQRPDTLYRPTCRPPTPDNPSLSVPQVRWWRAQATRFLMRWPSLHLCHVTNLIRHVSISHHVAARLAFFEDTQAEIIRDVAADTAGESARSDVRKSKQAKELQGMELGKGVEIESVSKASWATIGGRCSVCEEEGWTGEVMGGGGGGDSWDMQAGLSFANVKKAGLEKKEKHVLYYVQKQNNLVVGVGREPYVMRPLASLIIGGTSGEGNGEGKGVAGGVRGEVEKEVEGRRLEEEEDEGVEGEGGAEGNGGEVGKDGAEKKGGAEVKAGASIGAGGAGAGGAGAGGAGGGGGGRETGMVSALMYHVHQLRLLEPHLAHVWLHTPSQCVHSWFAHSSFHSCHHLPSPAITFPHLPSPSLTCHHLPSPAITFPHLPSPSLTCHHLPSPAITFPHLPSPSLTCHHLPSPAITFPHLPSPSLTCHHLPSPAITFPHLPSPSLTCHHLPSPAITFPHLPSPSLTCHHLPSPAITFPHLPSPSLTCHHLPSPAITFPHLPSPSLTCHHLPSPAITFPHLPSPSLTCHHLPSPAITFPHLPSPSLTCHHLPSPAITFPHLPSPSLTCHHLPSPAITFPHLPSPSLTCHHLPSPAITFPHLPSPSLTCHHLPSPAITFPNLPSPSLTCHHLPSPAITFPHLPSPSLTCHHLPSPAITFPHLPSPSLTCHHLPSPAITFPHLPSPSLTCHHLPSPAITFPHLPSPSLTCHHLPSPAITFHPNGAAPLTSTLPSCSAPALLASPPYHPHSPMPPPLSHTIHPSLLPPCCSKHFHQALITKASNYRDWTFLHSTNQTSPAPTAQDSGAAAVPTTEARALASLLVASQGDFFVGGLRSHWGRLVNELRSTNGRLFNVFVAMDDDEW
ncbi:unnamed protein product, partial [Closterium sp. Yama58-4]